MKIAFISNFYNHHQQPISEELYELTDGEYRFIATGDVPEERKNLGYTENQAPFVMKSADDDAKRWITDADVLISGFVGEELLEERKRRKKLILRYSERPLKNGFEWKKYPYRWLKWRKNVPRGVPVYLLCAGAYVASDYAAFGLFREKALKWGYFPEFSSYNVQSLIKQKNKREILWCGRFLDWKHPDDALTAAKMLKADGIDFHMSFIGTGEMAEKLRGDCTAFGLDDNVAFIGAMPPDQVRGNMEKTGIALLTSDQKEGWGAVLNEAMNSACAVVATKEAGSTPYLVRDDYNGLVYDSGDTDALYMTLKQLLTEPSKQERLGSAAYETIQNEWNARIAAKRLIKVCETILAGEDFAGLYTSGPCSPA